ncbi:MAG: acyl-CoA thioesterase [Candidatus Brocadiaceae bacterium]|nr:acyl-CoA thioesterase [Candidatus Brocadiaceae bacterium]
MVVWLRLIITFIRSSFREPINSSEEIVNNSISMGFRIWPTECELTFVNQARYLTFMEASRLDLMRRTGHLFLLLKNGWGASIAAQYISYKRPLKRFQKFEVTSQIIYWNKKWFYFEHRFLRNGKLMAHAIIKIIVVSKKSYVNPETVFHARNLQLLSIEKPQSVLELEEFEKTMVGSKRSVLR